MDRIERLHKTAAALRPSEMQPDRGSFDDPPWFGVWRPAAGLSRRHSTQATTADELVAEQLAHFGISPDSPRGAALAELVRHLGAANGAAHEVWNQTAEVLSRVGSRRPNRLV
jgi:hypothetical protein